MRLGRVLLLGEWSGMQMLRSGQFDLMNSFHLLWISNAKFPASDISRRKIRYNNNISHKKDAIFRICNHSWPSPTPSAHLSRWFSSPCCQETSGDIFQGLCLAKILSVPGKQGKSTKQKLGPPWKQRFEIKGWMMNDFLCQVNFFFCGVVIANRHGQNELNAWSLGQIRSLPAEARLELRGKVCLGKQLGDFSMELIGKIPIFIRRFFSFFIIAYFLLEFFFLFFVL